MSCGRCGSSVKVPLVSLDRAIVISDDSLDVVDDLLTALDDPSGVGATKASCCVASLGFCSIDGCSGRFICSQFICTLKPVDVHTFTAWKCVKGLICCIILRLFNARIWKRNSLRLYEDTVGIYSSYPNCGLSPHRWIVNSTSTEMATTLRSLSYNGAYIVRLRRLSKLRR